MIKKLVLLTLILITLSFLSPTLILATGYNFQDEFNLERTPNTLDTTKWTTYPNTPNGVTSIQETGGNLQISQQNNTSQFPLVISKNILPKGDLSIDIKFQYNKVTGWGTGFALTEQAPINGGGFNNSFAISVWQDTLPYNLRIGYGYGYGVERIIYQTQTNSNAEHLFSVKYIDQKYSIYLDGRLIYISQNTTNKVKFIWLGNPSIQNPPIPLWTSFKIDYVRVTNIVIPFLDLPWDYSSKGLTFNDAALSINSFFDHQYPLFSRGLDLTEPATASVNIVNYLGQTTNKPYSKHDGYDWGNSAKAKLGDPVLAAASGSATYINSCSSCGNMVVIDHGNGYQTRYMHLQKDGLIADIPNQSVSVNNRQQIGKVGWSGNVDPADERGAHIHFGVFQDKDGDGNFTDNEPDGVTDPFGWQSDTIDPWPNYNFNYSGQNRSGNKSYYLWKNNLASMISAVSPSSTATMNVGSYTLTFPQNSTNQNVVVNAKSAPVVQPSNNLVSVGSTLLIKATDTLGNIITRLQNPFILKIDFSSLDISKIKADTLSFYSSPDGINWTKENTTFPTQTQALANIDHFSYFALIGERKDTTPPITTAVLSGTERQPHWFKSSIDLALNASDNEGGLGVYYTAYKANEGAWQIYDSPINFTNEGHYKIEFYSVDEDENTESLKSVEFDIDKTPPQASLDTSIYTIWPPNGKMVPVNIFGTATDDNLYQTEISVDDEYKLIEQTFIMTGSDFSQTVQLEAKRKGNDSDGRVYTVNATATDLAGNLATASAQINVPHDQRR